MLRINELLNPIGPEESGGNGDKIAHASSRVSNSWHRYQVLNIDQQRVPSITPTEQILLSTPGTQGPVNFPPFESVDEKTRQELTAFNIPQFGSIMKSYEHIPYNSSKKDFFAKTGRESFKYTFQIPRNPAVFTVMWDYNIGLVRMTPFFKCMGYPKTRPSQMLDKNPGLRDICPSITGGAVFAQGYWMPYKCAKAVCATFCYGFAAALIPLFGPGFPSECISPDSAHFSSMTINQELIKEVSEKAQQLQQGPAKQSATSYIFSQRPPGRNVRTPRPTTIGGNPQMNTEPISRPHTYLNPVTRRQQQNDKSRADDQGFYPLPRTETSAIRRPAQTSEVVSSSHASEYFPAVKAPETTSLRRPKQVPSTSQSYETSTRSRKRRKLSSDASCDGVYDSTPRHSQSTRTSLPKSRLPRGTNLSEQKCMEERGAGSSGTTNTFVTGAGEGVVDDGCRSQAGPFVWTPGRRKSI
ncbi:hypothetical protein H634G_04436 [Metarhizium anisopliae BRIP 53293]|uniref:HTH APSES-type domain-containing protein n=1 Tax=Metarhizium anisopliae BRIP 53293 TaxID=1291518 RepID=A0A0D9P1P4_METAN|nr:hypothetical protein H634G_04436 [Metarhizium anisopliae BRIP 53293]KJK92947.1 hypothetical protein H633G_03323 [Metarhizium anisopliae BRIP 53284]